MSPAQVLLSAGIVAFVIGMLIGCAVVAWADGFASRRGRRSAARQSDTRGSGRR